MQYKNGASFPLIVQRKDDTQPVDSAAMALHMLQSSTQ
jgi:hypothetical protein